MSNPRKLRKRKPKKSEVHEQIEEFFHVMRNLFKGKDLLVEAACSSDIKIRERAQYDLLTHEKFQGPQSDVTILNKYKLDYLNRCRNLSKKLNCPIEYVIGPESSTKWNKLHTEFHRMLQAEFFIRASKEQTQKAKQVSKYKEHGKDNRLQGFQHIVNMIKNGMPDPALDESTYNSIPNVLGREIKEVKDIENCIRYYYNILNRWNFCLPSIQVN